MLTKETVMAELKHVLDPEMGFNVVELGLIYAVEIKAGKAHITMTLTSMACPAGPQIVDGVKAAAQRAGAKEVKIDVTFQPPWTPEKMSEDVRMALGMV
ncbi:MAG: metal-sulfur cluster assembly factor [Candidatus Aenigmarchaeota archaeon]|nr:metal-sulfur cluster assembly factor [Candidatus Aenigmarchaeota archaeon]